MAVVDFKKLAGQLAGPVATITKHQKAIDDAITKVDGKLAKVDALLKKVLAAGIIKKHPKVAEPIKKIEGGVATARKALATAQQVEKSLAAVAAQGNIVAKGMAAGGDHKKLKEGLIKAIAASKTVHGPLDKVEKDLALVVKVLAVSGAALGALALVTEGATAPLAAELEAMALELRSVDKVLKGISIGLTAFEKTGDIIVKAI